MKEKLKRWLGIARPGGLDDFAVRTAKTAVAVFLAQPFVPLLQGGTFDPNLARAAAMAAAAAVVGAVINGVIVALAKFANS